MPCWVKFLTGLLAGAGAGLVMIDQYAARNPNYWQTKDPPAGFFASIGVGCLVAAVTWLILFLGFRDRRATA
jgi:hypothetical protein